MPLIKAALTAIYGPFVPRAHFDSLATYTQSLHATLQTMRDRLSQQDEKLNRILVLQDSMTAAMANLTAAVRAGGQSLEGTLPSTPRR